MPNDTALLATVVLKPEPVMVMTSPGLPDEDDIDDTRGAIPSVFCSSITLSNPTTLLALVTYVPRISSVKISESARSTSFLVANTPPVLPTLQPPVSSNLIVY